MRMEFHELEVLDPQRRKQPLVLDGISAVGETVEIGLRWPGLVEVATQLHQRRAISSRVEQQARSSRSAPC